MKVRVRPFFGMRPAQGADLLSPGEAVVSTNTRLTSGYLESFRGLTDTPILTFSGAAVRSIYRFAQENVNEDEFWFQHTADMNVVKGPIDSDTEERTYITGRNSYPEKTKASIATGSTPYPSTTLRMGLPAPAPISAPTVSGTATNPADPLETVVYVTTYVSSWGEEGPPSQVSSDASWRPGQTVDITGLPTAPGAGYDMVSKNLYRSATGSSNTQFQLVATIPIATTTYADTTLTADLGTTLPTNGWVAPPDDMVGLVAMANGVLAGFTGNTLCLSEPYAPYAWPVRYQRSTDAPIVAIAAFDQSLFIGTTTGIYVLTGADPANMSMDKLSVAQSCVSKRSVVSMLGGVIFASPDGLFRIDSTGIRSLTEGLMTRVHWQEYVPSSITAFESDSHYIAFFDTGARQGGMLFSFGDKPTFSETDVYATAGYRDNSRDALFLVTSGNHLRKWDDKTADPLTYEWQSGVFNLPYEVNMACARVDATSYPVTFQLYADDAAVGSPITVTGKYAFRLPAGYRSRRYAFSLTGTEPVRAVELADSMQELARG